MKLVTWNVNGIRSFDGKWRDIVNSLDADIICVQETKVTRDMLDEPTALVDGYSSYFSFSRKRTGYSGVATYCKSNFMPIKAEEGLVGTLPSAANPDAVSHCEGLDQEFTGEELKSLDAEGRCVITVHKMLTGGEDVKDVAIFNLYCPRADPEKPERQIYKLHFYKALEIRARNLIRNGIGVIIVGDINTSHREIDHCDPYEAFGESASRKWMDHFLGLDESPTSNDDLPQDWRIFSANLHSKTDAARFTDAFRRFHPDAKESFTCWQTSTNCRANNFGTRIDYILASEALQPFLSSCDIHPDVMGSDHCPVSAKFEAFTSSAASKLPTYATKNFPEFSGNQQKLSAYFTKKRKASPEKMELKNVPTKKKTIQQSNISSFFVKKSSFKEELKEEALFKEAPKDNEAEKRLKSAASAWKSMMKGPPSAPLCKGHNEVSLLRTVKKKGPNLGRQFYCCPRGEGKSGDPNARCDFFKWVK